MIRVCTQNIYHFLYYLSQTNLESVMSIFYSRYFKEKNECIIYVIVRLCNIFMMYRIQKSCCNSYNCTNLNLTFSVWCLLKDCTYLKKPAVESCRVQVCVSFQWIRYTKVLECLSFAYDQNLDINQKLIIILRSFAVCLVLFLILFVLLSYF